MVGFLLNIEDRPGQNGRATSRHRCGLPGPAIDRFSQTEKGKSRGKCIERGASECPLNRCLAPLDKARTRRLLCNSACFAHRWNQLFGMDKKSPSSTTSQALSSTKAQHGYATEGPNGSIIKSCSHSLSGVLDQDCSGTIGDRLSLPHINWVTIEMDDDDRRRTALECLLVGIPIRPQCMRVDIVEQNIHTSSIGRCREIVAAIGGQRDRAATNSLCRAQRQCQCCRSAVGEQRRARLKSRVNPAEHLLSVLTRSRQGSSA